MNNIMTSVLSGTILVIITILVNYIYQKICEKRKQPEWLKYLEKFERSQIKQEIVLFHADRRNEAKYNSEEKKWLCSAYERYKQLQGNSYIDEVYKDIIENWKVID